VATVEDEDSEDENRNVAPRNKNHILELADGSDDDDLPQVVNPSHGPAKKVSSYTSIKNLLIY
jgi:hypothetical protein